MFLSRLPLRILAWSLVGCLVATNALAQQAPQAPPERPERPYRGLFGRGGRGLTTHALTFDAALGTGTMTAVGLDDEESTALSGSTFSDASSRIDYRVERDRFGFSARGQVVARYFPTLTKDLITSRAGSVQATADLSSRISVTSQYAVLYEPQFALSLFPALDFTGFGTGATPIINADTWVGRTGRTNHDSGLWLDYQLSARNRATVTYGHNVSRFTDRSLDYSSDRLEARIGHQLGPSASFAVGYRYLESIFPSDTGTGHVPYHAIDIGIDYSRALSFSRRTTVSFTTGSAVDRNADRTALRLIGTAMLNHEIGRSWNASFAFRRGAGFPGLALQRPVFADTLSAGVSGLIGRRLEFHSSVGVARGDTGFEYEEDLSSASGNVGATIGLTRYLGVDINYTYYRYNFQDGTFLPEGVPAQLDRHSLRASLALWVPLVY